MKLKHTYAKFCKNIIIYLNLTMSGALLFQHLISSKCTQFLNVPRYHNTFNFIALKRHKIHRLFTSFTSGIINCSLQTLRDFSATVLRCQEYVDVCIVLLTNSN